MHSRPVETRSSQDRNEFLLRTVSSYLGVVLVITELGENQLLMSNHDTAFEVNLYSHSRVQPLRSLQMDFSLVLTDNPCESQ